MDCYYNLIGYFTIKNIQFSAIERRPGGKGRGEIDLLAVKLRGDDKPECLWIEVSVSVSDKFPFSSSSKDTDTSGSIIKKFFESDARHKIRRYGLRYPKYIFISSDFKKNVEEKFGKRLEHWDAKLIKSKTTEDGFIAHIEYNGVKRRIQIIRFSEILCHLKAVFERDDLTTKNFQDPRLRSIQYLVRN